MTHQKESQSSETINEQRKAITRYFDIDVKQNQNSHGTTKKKVKIIIPMDNVYVQTVFKLFKQFLIEEATGCVFTDLRLCNNLKKARELHNIERKAMCNGLYFGVNDETNTELIFTD